MARYGRNPKVDFVKMLPQKLVYKVFCYIDDYRDFATCTHVSRVWHQTLMTDMHATNIWSKRSTVFFKAYPLKWLTSEEHCALAQALRGEQDCPFSFVAYTFERAQAIGGMGNCGLQSVGT
ncbi:hypothetical protein BDB00DRAFT_26725 [Zychaea mexicana]|uniref:uncharacterized protein n=1 Tax=Zychaea mexicana TaxID=64656 RepID=UPI0022FF074E|nr:uncharacterized protein BDB00DRAFT_26725 [Zychaea mexicana]KAI9488781.1 hypothetical protein BDB00DRAFT_26725 [Zychaea mexicana]